MDSSSPVSLSLLLMFCFVFFSIHYFRMPSIPPPPPPRTLPKKWGGSYRGEPKKISTPGEGTIVHDGSYDLMSMNGRKVYAFATREVPAVLLEALEEAGMSVDQVDHLLLHQANIRIMEVVADRLGMPMEKVITNLYKYGNTSAASIPLALDEAVRSGRVKKGDVIACAGFGAGLSWGAAILRWG